jgi:hypothetical protein
VAVAERHAGERLDVELVHRLELRLGKPPHLLLREGDVLEQRRAQRVSRDADVVAVDDERRRVPAVQVTRARS